MDDIVSPLDSESTNKPSKNRNKVINYVFVYVALLVVAVAGGYFYEVQFGTQERKEQVISDNNSVEQKTSFTATAENCSLISKDDVSNLTGVTMQQASTAGVAAGNNVASESVSCQFSTGSASTETFQAQTVSISRQKFASTDDASNYFNQTTSTLGAGQSVSGVGDTAVWNEQLKTLATVNGDKVIAVTVSVNPRTNKAVATEMAKQLVASSTSESSGN